MKVALTGASGFIGTQLAQRLVAVGHEVIPVDIRSGIDITKDITALNKAFEGCERVVHLAACLKESAPFEQMFDINVVGTLNVVNAAAHEHVGRVIHGSTCAVYHLRGSYAGTKAAAESLLRSRCRTLGMDSVCFRMFNVYGPTQTASQGALVPTVIENIKHNRQTMIHGNGQQTRDFIYIDDIVLAYQRAIEAVSPMQHVAFDIGTGWASRVQVVVTALYHLANKQPLIQFAEMPPHVSLRSRANTAMMFERLDITNPVKLQDGLALVWEAANKPTPSPVQSEVA